jgi:hypothetical protein
MRLSKLSVSFDDTRIQIPLGEDFYKGVSMQWLSATITVMPKGRIINSCTVDYQTVFMLIMETQVSKLTEGLWSKLNFKFQYFLDSLNLKMVTSKNQNSVSDSSTVFYPSANIFIIKFGNVILHLTSNGNLIYCNTTLYNCDFGQRTGQASRVPPSPYVLEFINAYLSFFWVHF